MNEDEVLVRGYGGVVTDMLYWVSPDYWHVHTTTSVDGHLWMRVAKVPADVELTWEIVRGVMARCVPYWWFRWNWVIDELDSGYHDLHRFRVIGLPRGRFYFITWTFQRYDWSERVNRGPIFAIWVPYFMPKHHVAEPWHWWGNEQPPWIGIFQEPWDWWGCEQPPWIGIFQEHWSS